jgi:hypothetical protein
MKVLALYHCCIIPGVDILSRSPCFSLALQIEWSKSYARAQRWTEKYHLLLEEMRRYLASMLYRARFWESLRTSPDDPGPESEGKVVFATQQASIARERHRMAIKLWSPFLSSAKATLPSTDLYTLANVMSSSASPSPLVPPQTPTSTSLVNALLSEVEGFASSVLPDEPTAAQGLSTISSQPTPEKIPRSTRHMKRSYGMVEQEDGTGSSDHS